MRFSRVPVSLMLIVCSSCHARAAVTEIVCQSGARAFSLFDFFFFTFLRLLFILQGKFCVGVQSLESDRVLLILYVELSGRVERFEVRLGRFPEGKEGRKEMFYLTTHSTHFIYGYMASDIW